MEKCHALNYSAACLPSLEATALMFEGAGWPQSALATRTVALGIANAQHFVLPDGGKLLDDGLRGLRGRRARLPFPSLTVEYFTPPIELPNGEGMYTTRRIALAAESTFDKVAANYHRMSLHLPSGEQMPRPPQAMGDTHLMLVSAVKWEPEGDLWTPQPLTLIVGETWEAPPEGDETRFQTLMYDPDALSEKQKRELPRIGMWPVPLLAEMANQIWQSYPTREQAYRAMVASVTDETTAVLELCEALTCVNVHMEKLQSVPKKVNDKRAAAGKLRLPEAWCLTVDVPAEIKQRGPWKGGTHRSPRTHLRRGTIRHLKSGNYWINSTIVGSGAVKIDKHYHLNPKRSPHHHHEGKHHD